MSEPTPDVKSVFGKALELPSAADRAAYLDAACVGHPALRAEVDALLKALDRAGDFLNAPPSDATRSHPDPNRTGSLPPATENPGTVIAGRYKLLQQIGEGGMGAVWMADQTEPVKRRVAVKLIRAERGASRTILSRFEAERQAIALMNHPNIAKLLDAGTTEEGSPFFVMELVKGVPLTDYCDANKLSVQDRLGLFRQICSAVHHAHQKGVIHRDLKPTNILVESHDGKPVPKVIDFGLAKATTGIQLTEHTLFTGFGSVMGTPLYMAPEQATFNAVDVDSRADIYALGVILYELLAGSTPIHRDTLKTAALDEMLRVIREQEPPPPSSRIGTSASRPSVAANRQSEPLKLGRFVRGELDWIVMKALAKERDRRYERATAFAADVERFLAHEPVTAGPPSQWYRLRKFVRRNKGRVVAASLVLFVLVAGVLGTSLGLVLANRAKELARAEEEKALVALEEKGQALVAETEAKRAETVAKLQETAARNRLEESVAAERQAGYDVTIPLVQKAIQENDYVRAAALLASCPEGLRNWEWYFLNRQFYWGSVTLRPAFSKAVEAGDYRFSADGKEIIHLSGATLTTWDAVTGATRHQRTLGRGDPAAYGTEARISPNGRLIALWFGAPARGATQVQAEADDRTVTLISTATGEPVARLKGAPERVRTVLFSPDTTRIATCDSGATVRVWDDAGALLRELVCDGARQAVPVAFTRDGKALVTNCAAGMNGVHVDGVTPGEGEFRVWDLENGTTRATGPLPAYKDGMASVPGKGTVISFPDSKSPHARLSPDGRYATGLASNVYRTVVDLTTGKETLRLPNELRGVGFLADGSLLALNPAGVCSVIDPAAGATLKTYPLSNVRNFRAGAALTRTVEVSDDGRWLSLYYQEDGTVAVREAATGREVRAVPVSRTGWYQAGSRGTVSPDGTRLLTAPQSGELKLWDLTARSATRAVKLRTDSTWSPAPAAVTADGRTAAVIVDREDPANPKSIARLNALELVDLPTGTSRVLKEDLGNVSTAFHNQVVFSPDGRKVAASGATYGTDPAQPGRLGMTVTPAVRDAATGELLFRGPAVAAPRRGSLDDANLPQLAFAADGVPLLAQSVPHETQPGRRTWRLGELAPDGRIRASVPADESSALRLSADGRLAAVLGRSGGAPAVEVWACGEARPLWSVPAEPGRRHDLDAVFSADGTRLLLTDAPSGSGPEGPANRAPRATVRDARTGRVISAFNAPATAQTQGMSISPDGRRVFWFTILTYRSVVVNADTGRELLANFDDGDSLAQFGRTRGLLTPVGYFLTGLTPTDGTRIKNKDACLRVRNGTPIGKPWEPVATVDDWLAEAHRLLDDPDPAKRDAARALALTEKAVGFYPAAFECRSAHGLALLRAEKYAGAAAMLLPCVVQEEGREASRAPVPRRAAEYFLLALAAQGTGQKAQAEVWFAWGETRLRYPEPVWATRLGANRGADVESERARAEPFRLEAARRLGLRADPIVPVDRSQLTNDPAHAGNRLMALSDILKRGDLTTGLWATEFLLAHGEPVPGLQYNAACIFARVAGLEQVDAGARQTHADRAVALLRQAVAGGFARDFARSGRDVTTFLKQDTDLDPLRSRDDFKSVLAEVEKEYPPREVAPPPRVK